MLLGLVVVICDLLPKVGAFLNPHRFVRIAVVVLGPVMPLLDYPLSWMMRFSDGFAEWLLPALPRDLVP
jgi:Mg2+/Co2+ transporter CorB